MQLVENWKEAWKWFSVQAITAAFIWEALPTETRQAIFFFIPDTVEPHVTALLLVVGAFGRIVDQKSKHVDN